MTDTTTLTSTFAMDQLSRVAKESSDLLFAQLLLPVFGLDMPANRLLALKAAALDGTFSPPTYQVGDSEGGMTSYDYSARVISVDRTAIETALAHPENSAGLLTAMLEAFGLHVYNLLYQELAGPSEGDAPTPAELPPEDLGHKYAATLMFMDQVPNTDVVYGDYTSPELSGSLTFSFAPLEDLDEETIEHSRQKRFSPEGGLHSKSFGHRNIEKVLSEVGFDADQIMSIYFGNWLRDHSQIVDAALIHMPGQPLQPPTLFSRAALTKLVDFLALKKFHTLQDTSEGRATYTVTPEMLGVYRASEHLDNPTRTDEDAIPPQAKDPDFEAVVHPQDSANELNPEYGRKRYFDSAVDYMEAKLVAAQDAGMTPEGMRYLGEALHVLEDLFAHSNFVELCLRKLNYQDVVVWTTEVDIPDNPAARHALVTGMFSKLDVLASLSTPLADALFKTDSLEFKPTKPGDRSDTEQMLLILLKDYPNPAPYRALEDTLRMRDNLARLPMIPELKAASWVMSQPLNAISHAKNLIMNPLLKYLGDNIGTLQLKLDGDPNTDANVLVTHSQLAKDHDTHCFHELAALLATDAVQTVGRAIYEYWNGNTNRNPASLATSFFVHPGRLSWYEKIVKPWAEANPEKIKQGSELELLRAEQERTLQEMEARLSGLDEKVGYNIIAYHESLKNLSPF
ncbi:HET-C-related protein [Pseudomonas sp. NPDC089554]|uniref:HET-C-related protein n=1 Tax=Pseudomonas sp. NPDC089554 TaxID=3390653 RepID=UPI003CFCE436